MTKQRGGVSASPLVLPKAVVVRFKQIPKRNGEFRTVAVPDPHLKMKLQEWVPYLSAVAKIQDKADVMHGFVPGRSPVTNAKQHIGYKYTLCMDIRDFFGTVDNDHTQMRELNRHIPQICKAYLPPRSQFEKAHPAYSRCFQGLPTSPAIANILASRMDSVIASACKSFLFDFKYTRYADDLTVSGNVLDQMKPMENRIKAVCHGFGMEINESKTKLMKSKQGRRIITGVAVGDSGIYPTRKIKRRIRAAQHQKNAPQVAGLSEWCRLREPDIQKYIRSKKSMLQRRVNDMLIEDVIRMQASLAILEFSE